MLPMAGFALLFVILQADGPMQETLDFANPPHGVHLIQSGLQERQGEAIWSFTTDEDQSRQLILEWEHPKISTAIYALEGEIGFNVEGSAYLELINDFGQDGTFFTRTMSQKGPMGLLKGSSTWRRFILPFYRNKSGSPETIEIPPPKKLSLYVQSTGPAEIAIRRLRLLNLEDHPDFSFVDGQWWTRQQTGLFFGILGSILGAIYSLMSISCAKGRHRRFVAAGLVSMALFGTIALSFAFIAAYIEQPPHITWPLFLLGFALLAFLLLLRPIFRAKYQAHELRKMESKDVL